MTVCCCSLPDLDPTACTRCPNREATDGYMRHPLYVLEVPYIPIDPEAEDLVEDFIKKYAPSIESVPLDLE